MNNTFLLLITLIFSFSVNAQTKDSNLDTTTDSGIKFYQIENYALSFHKIATSIVVDFKIDTDYIKKPFFQKYNSTSSQNDLYLSNSNGTYSYVKSNLYLENLYRGVKIDSYNPRGMSPNGTSVIFGVFGVFLDRLQQ